MNLALARAYVVELIGVFCLVYVGAGIVCVNEMTQPLRQPAEVAALADRHPGLVGVALVKGLLLAALLAVTMHVSGGYLNPAVTITLWVFSRLDSRRAVFLLGSQLVGAAIAGMCLRLTFDVELLRSAHLGAPRLNPLAYHELSTFSSMSSSAWLQTLTAGVAVELVLTFILVFAIFGTVRRKTDWLREETGDTDVPSDDPAARGVEARMTAFIAGAAAAACVLFGSALTGAALNPAMWFGPAMWHTTLPSSGERGPFADTLVYTAGPVLGALLAGCVWFLLLTPNQRGEAPAKSGKKKKRAS